MPEMPEVETIRSQLADTLTGRTIATASIEDARLVLPVDPEVVATQLVGRVVCEISRRGKYLLFALDGGLTAIVHLRMTGQLHWQVQPAGDPPYRRACITFVEGGQLLMCDMRRFGTLSVVPTARVASPEFWKGRVGLEPLSPNFTASRLGELLRGRHTAIKAALLNQALVAGIGNIYADEALFAAGVHPERRAGSLSTAEIGRLHRAIRDRLRVAIAAGGSSIDRYRDSRGERGAMQTLLRVHLQAGQSCGRCGETIVKTRVAQRGTYHCPGCQSC